MIDLSGYELVFKDDFDKGLNAYRNGAGLWSTSPRRDDLMTNGPQSVFLSDATTTANGQKVGLNPLKVAEGALHIGSGVIPQAKLDLVREALTDVGRGAQAQDVKYYTGMVSTQDSWAQAYGYYEITAEIPVGQGQWPAFWLAPAGLGWPPEIDIFEIYSKGIGGTATPKDYTFSSAVFFDRIDAQGDHSQSVDVTNPHDLDANGDPARPMVKHHQQGEQYVFGHTTNTMQEFGVDLHDGKWTWAAEWTPDYIAFYFGRDRDSMVEIYRTPTPEDLTTPMYTIINNQIGSTWGWNPAEGLDHLTFARGNDFRIDSVSVYAIRPDRQLVATRTGDLIVDDEGSTRITGSSGNDTIVTGGGAGQDFVTLGGGKDMLFFSRGTGNAIVSEFGADDRLVLEGFHFDGVRDVLARLTQVGDDVWLANGAYPGNPQTLIFRDRLVQDFSADQFLVRWSVTPNVWSSLKSDPGRLRDTDGDGMVQAERGGSRLEDTSSHVGAVTLRGGAGGDEYHVYRANTVVREAAEHRGVDTVYSARTFALPLHVENLTATSNARDLTLVGNAADNRIEGNSLSNTLQGGRGDDLIISHGADQINYALGDGKDVILGFDPHDHLRLEGYDITARALVARLIQSGDDLRLDLGASGSITFRDSTRADFSADSFQIVAGGTHKLAPLSDGDPTTPGTRPELPEAPTGNVIEGNAGHDTLRGSAAGDVLLGHAGNDLLRGFDGNDWLAGGSGSNHLNGGSGNDTLIAAGAADTLYGAEGADTFVLTAGSRDAVLMDLTAQDHLDIRQFADQRDHVRLDTTGAYVRVSTLEGDSWSELCRVRTASQQDVWDALVLG